MAKETAEQKLLKIIEATDAQQANAATATAGGGVAVQATPEAVQQLAASVKSTNVSFQLPPFLGALLAPFKSRSSTAAGQLSIGLREINSILLSVIAVALLFFVFDVSKSMKYSKQDLNYTASSKGAPASENLIPSFKDMSDYITVVSRRNIFQPLDKKEEAVVETVTPEQKRRITEQAKDLKLVGVSWLDTPESASALIENKTSGVTYFLKQGDTINGVGIKEIYADSVLLTLEGDNFKLSL